jgi:hypothetical protein
MNITEQLGADYRFTDKDIDLAWEIFARTTTTEDEDEFRYLAHIAEEMHRKSGQFPTLSEATAEHWRREDAYWQLHFKKNAPR